VFADVPGEVAETGDLRAVGVDADAVKPFADVVTGEAGRSAPDDVLLVESVGSAVLDAAAGAHLYERAVGAGVGREVDR
jgi:alanine dehydrogenase